MSFKDCTFTSPRAALRISRLLKLLADPPQTSSQLAARLHCSKTLVSIYLWHLMDSEPRQARIADHSRQKCGQVPMYAAGSAPDAVPVLLTKKERYAITMNSPELHAERLAKRRAQHAAKRKAKPPEQIKRSRAMYNPPLIGQVAAMIAERPRYTTGQLAIALGVAPNSVSTAANRLAREGKVEGVKIGKSKRLRWVSLTKPPVQHAPVTMPKQSIFSALGI